MKGKSKKVVVHIMIASKEMSKIIDTQVINYTTTEVKYEKNSWFVNASNPSMYDEHNNPIILLDLTGKKIVFEKNLGMNDPAMDGLLIGNKLIEHLAIASMPKDMRKKLTFDQILMYACLFLAGLGVGLMFPSLLTQLGGG